jgi:glycosyltransferase involved in cell wall biosynthesis
MHMNHMLADGDAQPETWIALLGRRDMPTDGLEDYCIFLGGGLSTMGVELRRVRVPWMDRDCIAALRELWRESASWRGQWVLIQYTAFAWSRRGFPLPALMILALLRRRDVKTAVVFHEPRRQGHGKRWIDRIRGSCQDWVIRRLYRGAAKSIFTVPLETVSWLPKGETKAAFIPIGANIPERLAVRDASALVNHDQTIIVFGVTGAPAMAGEIKQIAGIVREASKSFSKLRLVAVGRGSMEAREQLVMEVDGSGVISVILGVVPAEEVAKQLQQADALLFVRGAINLQRGSVMAGVASGIPIVGYGDEKVIGPLREAGIEWSPSSDYMDFACSLVRVLSDRTRWRELHARNLAAQKNYFSWSRIATQFRAELSRLG